MSAEQTPDIETAQVVLRDQLHSLRRHDRGAWRVGAQACAPCDQDADQLAQALAPVLAAAVREAKVEAWDEGARTVWEPLAYHAWSWEFYADDNPYRADRVAEPQQEAATSSKESEASDE